MKHEIFIYNKSKKKIPKKFIENIILKTLDFLKLKQPVELAVLIVRPLEIKRLNKIWRHKNYTPDELSFGLNSRQTAGLAKRKNNVLELGEIVINADKISNKNNLTKVLIHGLLHLLGYDHETSRAEVLKMGQLESKMLKYFKL